MFNYLKYGNEFDKQYPDETKEELEKRLKKGWNNLNGIQAMTTINKKVVFSFYSFFPKNEVHHWIGIFPRIIEEREDMIKYAFDSKDYPPIDYIEKISKLYPNLHFKIEYIVRDNANKGFCEVKNGKTIKDIKEYFELDFGICPSCKEEVGISLLDEPCPSCHKILNKIMIDDGLGKLVETESHCEHNFADSGFCPFCNMDVGFFLLGEYCPSCHEMLDKIIVDCEPEEYITFGTCSVCKAYGHIGSDGLCGSCWHINNNK